MAKGPVVKRKAVLKKPLARRTLRTALVLDLKQKEQARRGNKVGAAGKTTTNAAIDVPISQRAGHPLVPTKVKPQNWKTKEGKQVYVDLSRVSWLPDDWGQGVKMTNPISRSRDGAGGTYTVWVGPEGHVFYHRWAIENFLGRDLGPIDGFNGQMRLASLQGKETDEKAFFNILNARERRHLVPASHFHFCVISARRTKTPEGLAGIATVEASFKKAGAQPTWYVDKDSLQDYRKLGLKAVVGGKLCEARNMALQDAQRRGLVCVQASDDIMGWEYRDGEAATEKSDEAANAAFDAATRHVISPVSAARFILAKMRGSPLDAEGERPHLGGVYCLGSCARTFGGEAFSKYNFILGDFFVADRSPVRFDGTMTLKEDYAFTCMHIEKHGSVLRCNRMTIQAKHQTNAGGACSIRDKKGREEEKNIMILMNRWPRAIRRHTTRAHEVQLQWPADGDATGEKRQMSSSSKPVKKAAVKKFHLKKSGLKSLPPAAVLRYTGKDAREPYITARCKLQDKKKVEQCLGTTYIDASGKQSTYGVADLRYDIQRGFLKILRKK
mmetsp:Transcript_99786/g.182979  ORF Transcript_99786/g.182979 Transcript_99786/m.182979 type:complete len:555 (+) Transcript_99786:85-1749(+)